MEQMKIESNPQESQQSNTDLSHYSLQFRHQTNAQQYLQEVPKDELVDWVDNPITKALQSLLKAEQEAYLEMFLSGSTISYESVDYTAQRTARDRGYIEGLQKSLLLIDDLLLEKESEE